MCRRGDEIVGQTGGGRLRAAEHERGGLGFGRVDFLQEFPVRVVVHNAAPYHCADQMPPCASTVMPSGIPCVSGTLMKSRLLETAPVSIS